MATATTHDIERQLVAYLNTSMSVDALSDWMDLHTLTIGPVSDREAYALSRTVIGALIRLEDGEITEPDLVASLSTLVGEPAARAGMQRP